VRHGPTKLPASAANHQGAASLPRIEMQIGVGSRKTRKATLYTEGSRQLRCLRCRFDCYRVERTSSRAGVAPAEVQRLFTGRTFSPTIPKWRIKHPPECRGQHVRSDPEWFQQFAVVAVARALLATQRHFGTRSDAHVGCDRLLHFLLTSASLRLTLSPFRRAFFPRLEAQHP
jgi:hypothetical protein